MIPRSPDRSRKWKVKDDEIECIVCGRPIKPENHKKWLWVHMGGNHAVTSAEGERLNASGERGADLGMQPVGNECLKNYPELKPFVLPRP